MLDIHLEIVKTLKSHHSSQNDSCYDLCVLQLPSRLMLLTKAVGSTG